MLTKEECEKAIDNVARYCSDYKHYMIPPRFELINELDVLMSLIQEHFELVELLKLHGYGMLCTEEFEHFISYICKHNADNDMIIMSQSEQLEQLEQIKNPQPYKFEELHEGMWVWDDKLNACFLIKELKPQSYWNVIIYANYLTDTFEEMHFEKNRFYPVTKSMEYQE